MNKDELIDRRNREEKERWPEMTEFATRLAAEGLECVCCLTKRQSEENLGYQRADSVAGLLAKRWRRVYEIKKEMGLLTSFEVTALAAIEVLCELQLPEVQDDIWAKVHGDPACFRAAYLLKQDCNLEYTLAGQTPSDVYYHSEAVEPACFFATNCDSDFE